MTPQQLRSLGRFAYRASLPAVHSRERCSTRDLVASGRRRAGTCGDHGWKRATPPRESVSLRPWRGHQIDLPCSKAGSNATRVALRPVGLPARQAVLSSVGFWSRTGCRGRALSAAAETAGGFGLAGRTAQPAEQPYKECESCDQAPTYNVVHGNVVQVGWPALPPS